MSNLLKSNKFILLIILILAFVVRIYFLFTTKFPSLVAGACEYDIAAKRLIQNGFLGYGSEVTHPNAYVTPGYPVFLAGVYSIFGRDLFAVRVIQIVLTVITVHIVCHIALEFLKPRFALFATALFAFYPSSIFASYYILTETLFVFLFLLFIYLFIIAFKWDRLYLMILSGFVLGLSTLTRPTPFLLVVPLFLYYFICEKNKLHVIRKCIVFLIPLIAVLLPWWIRNYNLYGQLILFTTSSANPLLMGAFEDYKGAAKYQSKIAAQSLGELQTNNLWKKEAIRIFADKISKHPISYTRWYLLDKSRYFWATPFFQIE